MPSVAEIVSLPSLSLEPVTLPHPQLRVRWVATSELPDPSPFLEGGELLLTTGLVERDDSEWSLLVERLRGAGAVGVGFAVGVNSDEVPGGLARAAERHGVNLFIVPRPTPFIAVSKAVADALAAGERTVDRRSLAHQQSLTRAALTGPSELVAELGDIVDGDVVLITPDGDTLLASSSGGADLAARVVPHVRRMRASIRRGAVSEIGSGVRVIVQPVESRGRVDAYLAIETEGAMGAAERTAVSTALALLTLDRDRAAVERDADRRIRSGAVALLLQGDADAARVVLGELPWRHARVMRVNGPPEEVEGVLASLERDSDVVASVIAEGELVVLFDREVDVAAFPGVRAGVGPVRPLASLDESDAAAREALAATTPSRPVIDFDELAVEGVDSIIPADALRLFATSLLGPVLERSDAADLLASLRAYLRHDSQVGPAASALGVHRNTLRNRLATAQGAMGRSLDDPQVRADLWIALKHVP